MEKDGEREGVGAAEKKNKNPTQDLKKKKIYIYNGKTKAEKNVTRERENDTVVINKILNVINHTICISNLKNL